MCYFAFMDLHEETGPFISVVIPNHNGAKTIGTCLEAALASRYGSFEVVVVDDCSTDGSPEIIRKFPCRLITLPGHGGASKARNTGAENARGEVLFFTDADCVVLEDTLSRAARAYRAHPDAVIGGTYTPVPYDQGFFSMFQSVFIHYSETKKASPDYVATHAMLIRRESFLGCGGFRDDFLPILEDVELSHRLRRAGARLVMEPGLMVRHIFNYSLASSLRNAVRKSAYWTMYSLKNRDLLTDSGTASLELKATAASWLAGMLLIALYAAGGSPWAIAAFALVAAANIFMNRKFIRALLRAGGPIFALAAFLYYSALYPAAVGAGGLLGAMRKT